MEYITYGYCRVSTPKQNIERQVRNILAEYPKAHIIKEVYTGTKTDGRKDWTRLYKQIQKDIQNGKKVRVVFDAVSRFSRNADEGCDLYEELFNQKIDLVFLKEHHIDTAVYNRAIQSQIDFRLSTGNLATDDFINTIIDALNKFTIDLAKEQIRLAFAQAEKEVMDLRQRTSEGMKTAKLNGKQIGRVSGRKYTTKKEVAAKEIIKKKSKFFNGSNTDKEVMLLAGISRATYYKYKAELQAAGSE